MDSHIGGKRKIEEINKIQKDEEALTDIGTAANDNKYKECSEEDDNGTNDESEEDDKDSKQSYTTKKRRASSALGQSKPIEGCVIGSETWIWYESLSDASRKLQLSSGSISKCLNDKLSRCGNYEFRYATPNEPDLLPGEEWKPYNNGFVSSFGRYRNCYGVTSTPKPQTSGYVEVKVNNKTMKIHRMIAIAFNLPKRIDQTTVDHIDGNPSNNRLENLRWASPSEQVQYSYKGYDL